MKLTPIHLTLLSLIASSANADQAVSQVVEIDEITVSADTGETEQVNNVKTSTFTTAGAVSRISADKKMQTLDSVVRALPGSFTNIDPAQGTVNVNLRNFSGLGRVNTMIDGVPQTFFGSSANTSANSRYHTDGVDEGISIGPSNQYGSMIDPNFLVGIDVDRGGQSGDKGVNALIGSTNLKTIGIDDVIFHGNKVGIRSRLLHGSNDYGHQAMLALAGKTQLWREGNLGAMLALSESRYGNNYKRGDNLRASVNEYYSEKTQQKPRSWLAKVEFSPNMAHKLLLTARQYRSNIGGRALLNKAHSLEYQYTPTSDYIDVELLASSTQNKQAFNSGERFFLIERGETTNQSDYFNIKNTSQIALKTAEISATYGISYFKNKYQRKGVGINQDNFEYTPFSPSGQQAISSYYLDTHWQKDIYHLDTALTYSRTQFTGFKPACGSVSGIEIQCIPQGDYQVKTRHNAVNPKVQFSAEISPYFMPYFSYSRSSRMPNIQEVFFNNEGGGSMNPFLKPEKAKNYEFGFNTYKNNVFSENDYLGIKANYFYSKIHDYIYPLIFYVRSSGQLTERYYSDVSPSFHAKINVNALEAVINRGTELQISYHSDRFFSNLSYTYTKTTQPTSLNIGNDFRFGSVTILPKQYGTLDLGTYWLNKSLTTGAIFKYYGISKRVMPSDIQYDENDKNTLPLQDLPKNPIIIDAYVNYQINKHLLMKFSVENLFNKLYIDPLNSQNSTLSQYVNSNEYSFTNYARGRTYKVGAEIRF